LDSNTVRRLGELLHGQYYGPGLAKDLGVSRVSVDNWTKDPRTKHPTDARRQAAVVVVKKRIADLRALLKLLERKPSKT